MNKWVLCTHIDCEKTTNFIKTIVFGKTIVFEKNIVFK